MKTPGIAAPNSLNEPPRFADPQDLVELGLAPDPMAGAPTFRDKAAALVRNRRSLRLDLEGCVRCGACIGACPVYRASKDPLNTPVSRLEFFRTGLQGKARPGDLALTRWHYYFDQCLYCRRCAAFCPLGLDPSEAARAGLEILAEMGLGERNVVENALLEFRTGNRYGLVPEVIGTSLAGLEQRVFEQTGMAVRFPVDVRGADVLLVPAVADYHGRLETMIGYGLLFHAAGLSWTVCTLAADAANHGWYLGPGVQNRVFKKLIEAMEYIRPQTLVWGECGHGWRAADPAYEGRGLATVLASRNLPSPRHIFDLAADLLEQGAFANRITKDWAQGLTFTYHDPCHLARSADLTRAPRILLGSGASFKEMPTRASGKMTHCCGAKAGSFVSPGPRINLGLARPLVRAARKTKADFLVTGCEGCRTVLPAALASEAGRPMEVLGVIESFGRSLMPFFSSLGKPSSRSKEKEAP